MRIIRLTVLGHPVGKPRMTHADKWKVGSKVRPEVARYRAWADMACLAATGHPRRKLVGGAIAVRVVAWFAIPPSWPAKRRALAAGRLHQGKPDIDNCVKSVLDSLLDEDKTIAHVRATKRYCRVGEPPRVEITLVYP